MAEQATRTATVTLHDVRKSAAAASKGAAVERAAICSTFHVRVHRWIAVRWWSDQLEHFDGTS